MRDNKTYLYKQTIQLVIVVKKKKLKFFFYFNSHFDFEYNPTQNLSL